MAEPAAAKRCLYEVLGVARDCSVEDIRSSYRRLALRLHPDKQAASGVSPEAATAAFQELIHAYEVLSDPKERAWYDSHRSQILFSAPSKSSSSPFSDIDIYSFVSSAAFSGYSDTGRGFYKVYGDLFSKLYAKELFFAERLGLGPDAVPPAPLMGNAESTGSQVAAFYSYWQGFFTILDFSWVVEYDVSAGDNRRSRRTMEEMNKKVMKKARRVYNDDVWSLAAFVKKRDKRVIEMQLKKKMEAEKKRLEDLERKEAARKKKMEAAMAYEEPEWAKPLEEEDVDSMDDERKKDGGELYCVVCSKKFKSEKQWKNHEQSKKHKEKVSELKDLLHEDEEFMDNVGGGGVGFDYKPPEKSDSDPIEDLGDDIGGSLCSEKGEDDVPEGAEEEEFGSADDASILEASGEEENFGSADEASVLESMLGQQSMRKSKGVAFQNLSLNEDVALNYEEGRSAEIYSKRRGKKSQVSKGGVDAEADDEALEGEMSKQQQNCSKVRNKAKNNGVNKKNQHSRGEVEAESGAEAAMREVRGAALPNDDGFSNQNHEAKDSEEGSGGAHKDAPHRTKGNRVKAKDLKHIKQVLGAKEPARDPDSSNVSKGRKQKASRGASNSCGTCGETFESRNKLFVHLGDTGHAMLKSR